MGRKTGVGLVFCIVMLLNACVFDGGSPSLRERINSQRDPGVDWTVRVKYWPERFEDPYTRVDTPLASTNRYTVLSSPGSSSSRRIFVESDTETYLLQLHSSGNIEVASRILDDDTSGVVTTKSLLANGLQAKAFFDPAWSPTDPVFFFHPDLTAREPHQRMRFDRESRYSGDWVIQTMDSSDTATSVALRHRPTKSRVEFYWKHGEPWWERARWYRSDRIVATARRMD